MLSTFYYHLISDALFKLLFYSMLDSNDLSGKIPERLFSIPTYKYVW